ncbi:hypothetical protein [Anabaena azotica]|uniref:Uncharacterized protein n=1 Tax=Anabaena azotica FACHB-119 TaxID=947527 RepID=A0ABR8D889_9NOST|nr:hypothetical protein [Anabaena azotica]MBD2502490.1 hypothetical protein [Anabaena azotica FACHB-119]
MSVIMRLCYLTAQSSIVNTYAVVDVAGDRGQGTGGAKSSLRLTHKN